MTWLPAIVVFSMFGMAALHHFSALKIFNYQFNSDWFFSGKNTSSARLQRYHKFLCRRMPFYYAMTRKGQARFLRRLLFLMLRKQIVGYQNLKITEEMALLILSTQVQLTWGMRRFLLPHFRRYILYPASFYSAYFETYLDGLTTGMGHITLSWAEAEFGLSDPNDNLNVILHEMAHALVIDTRINNSSDIGFERVFKRNMAYFKSEMNRFRTEPNEYLRGYAAQNENEFLAVCVEHFFESPHLFKTKMPELYRIFMQMLQLDPLRPEQNYKLI